MIWYKELGFNSNPFSIKPAAFHDRLFGAQDMIDRVMGCIRDRKIALVDGSYGLGKTTLLKRVIREFKGDKRLAYYSCNRAENRIDVDGILIGARGFLGRLLRLKSKNMILLLDEAESITPEDSKNLYNAYAAGYLDSIVIVSSSPGIDISGSLAKLIGGNRFSIRTMNEQDAIGMIRARAPGIDLLTDNTLRKLWAESGKNPRKLLMACEEACRNAVENGHEIVSDEVMDNPLS